MPERHLDRIPFCLEARTHGTAAVVTKANDRELRGPPRRWGTVRARESLVVHAPPERLAALYMDHAHWNRLFPATIRGTRFVKQTPGEIVVEVDHRTGGRVINVIRPLSPTEIALDEFKPTFDATFVNRFEAVAEGTRYVVDADVRLRRPYTILAPFVGGLVRRRVRRYVLEPMRVAAEGGE